MDRFQQPDCEPETPQDREDAQFGWYGIRKAAEKLALKDELIEAFYQIGYSLRGERVLRDSKEIEYEFKSGEKVIKVIVDAFHHPPLSTGREAKPKLSVQLLKGNNYGNQTPL